MSCDLGSIPVDQQRAHGINADYEDMPFIISSTPQVVPVAISKQTTTSTISTFDTYWGLQVPASGVLGVCTGTNTIAASPSL